MSELAAKEIVNLMTGERLGLFGDADLLIDEDAGAIVEMAVPGRRGLIGGRSSTTIPWSAVRRIGPEVVLVELEEETQPSRRSGLWVREVPRA
jgi:YlmC/YmxH family sporulation protein